MIKKSCKSQGIPKFCEQFIFRNILFLIFMVLDYYLRIKSANIKICKKFSNCRWMKMAIICLPIGLQKWSRKWSKVKEKSVKSQGISKRILSGDYYYYVFNCINKKKIQFVCYKCDKYFIS